MRVFNKNKRKIIAFSEDLDPPLILDADPDHGLEKVSNPTELTPVPKHWFIQHFAYR